MNQAFHTGIIGTQTHQYGLDVVADNLANINTTGFRSSQVEFASLFGIALEDAAQSSTVSSVIGYGSRVQATAIDLSGGSLYGSDQTTNLAIDGDGWFGIASPEGKFYTRAGDFLFDASRDLVTPEGNFVLGTLGNNIANGVVTEVLDTVPLGDANGQVAMNLPDTLTFPVQPSTVATFNGNLGVDGNEIRKAGATVIDPEGNRNNLQLTFTFSDPQPDAGISWDVTATVSSIGDDATLFDTQSGVLTFDEFGALESNTLGPIDNNGAAVAIDLGAQYTGVIAIANESAGTFSSSSDGLEGGDLVGYEINQNADVVATFTNGRQTAIAKVAVYHFQNDQGLERVSGTLFRESSNSGDPIFFTDAEGNPTLGTTVRNGTLENSNVRFEVGLTELIILQRAFDANAKSITTGDELVQKALQMDA